MIIFLIIIFIIIFVYKTFFLSNFLNKLDSLDKIIYICLFLFTIWVLLALYYLYSFLYRIIFLTGEIHQFDTETMTEYFLHNYLVIRFYYFLTIILLVIFFILLHIFAFWMIIILFVPFIIIVPIPIIPFILPIPLKTLLLIPFQKLTDRGILPLMRRVLLGFISEDTTKHLINSSYNIYGFFYDNLREMINDVIILNEPYNDKISKGIQDDKYKTSTIDDENEELSKEIVKKDGGNKNIKKLIKDEYLLCVKRNKGINKFGENNEMNNMYGNNKSKFDCNFNNLKSYLKIKI